MKKNLMSFAVISAALLTVAPIAAATVGESAVVEASIKKAPRRAKKHAIRRRSKKRVKKLAAKKGLYGFQDDSIYKLRRTKDSQGRTVYVNLSMGDGMGGHPTYVGKVFTSYKAAKRAMENQWKPRKPKNLPKGAKVYAGGSVIEMPNKKNNHEGDQSPFQHMSPDEDPATTGDDFSDDEANNEDDLLDY